MPKELPKKNAQGKRALRTKQDKKSLRLISRSALEIINSLSAHIAILDQDGVILATNRAWEDFARANEIRMRPDMINVNYLAICDSALKSDSAENAGEVSELPRKSRWPLLSKEAGQQKKSLRSCPFQKTPSAFTA